MHYQQFIKQSLSLITKYRKYQEIVINYVNLELLDASIIQQNIYFEVYAHTKLTSIKIQEWAFARSKTLLKSVNLQSSQQQDHQLSEAEVNSQQFFKILENIAKNVNPKLIFKLINVIYLEIIIKNNEQDLILFDGQQTFMLDVSQYEGKDYQCNLKLKYNYEYQMEQLEQYRDSQNQSNQFQLLIDQYQNNKQQEEQQNRKFSEDYIISQTNEKHSPIKHSNSNQISKLIQIFNNINFKTIQSSTLKQFLSNYPSK